MFGSHDKCPPLEINEVRDGTGQEPVTLGGTKDCMQVSICTLHTPSLSKWFLSVTDEGA